MRIASVRHAVPSLRMNNQWILDRVTEQSRHHLPPDRLAELQAQITRFLEIAGTKTRYQLEEGETAIDFALQASEAALRDAAMRPEEIDFLIYAGVGRGWIEPATAHVFQAELGLRNATCFDILDACAGWLRAMQIAHHLIGARTYRRGIIVNCECGFESFAQWSMRGVEDLEHLFATCTIGEAAAATIVSDENPDDDFYFAFKTFSEYYPLSMIPLNTLKDYAGDSVSAPSGPNKFFSLSREIMDAGVEKVVQSFRDDSVVPGREYDLILCHPSTERACQTVLSQLGLSLERYFPTHPDYGNTVSASLPLGLSLARDQGRLKRGDKVLIPLGAAGITVGLSSFTF